MNNTAKKRYYDKKGREVVYVLDSGGWIQRFFKEGLETPQHMIKNNISLVEIIDPLRVNPLDRVELKL